MLPGIVIRKQFTVPYHCCIVLYRTGAVPYTTIRYRYRTAPNRVPILYRVFVLSTCPRTCELHYYFRSVITVIKIEVLEYRIKSPPSTRDAARDPPRTPEHPTTTNTPFTPFSKTCHLLPFHLPSSIYRQRVYNLTAKNTWLASIPICHFDEQPCIGRV
jgi:hypothetical protein